MTTGHNTSVMAMPIWQRIHSGILGLIMLFTLVSNSLLIVVLKKMKSRRSNKDSASYNIEKSYMYLLFHLAFADMLSVILNIPFDIIESAGVHYHYHVIGCKLLMPLQLASTTAQAGTYVVLSYHRFRAIVYPIRANLTVCKSILMIGIIWSAGVCLSLPYVVVLDENCGENWPQENLSSRIYTFTIFIIQYAVPVSLMAVFYLSIARTLHNHRIAKQLVQVPTNDDARSHRHIVKMLVTIVTVYSVCMLPHHLLWIIKEFHPMDKTKWRLVSSILYLFTYSNSVANPVIFFFYNKESRYHLKRFCKKFCCCARNMELPFEIGIMKWSATWNSKTDSMNPQERKISKAEQRKLDHLYLEKPGDSDLGVSLPWEAQMVNSQASNTDEFQEYRECDTLTAPTHDTSLFTFNPVASLIDTSEPSQTFSSPATTQNSKLPTEEGKENPRKVPPNPAFHDNDKEEEICVEVESSSSGDGTGRVESIIKEMMEDVAQEMRKDVNSADTGICLLENFFQLDDGSSNGELETAEDDDPRNAGVLCVETRKGQISSSQDLIKELICFLENSPHGTERDICALQEHLRTLPETRM